MFAQDNKSNKRDPRPTLIPLYGGRELKAPTRGLTTRAEAGYREK
jgi:hypothetical protein